MKTAHKHLTLELWFELTANLTKLVNGPRDFYRKESWLWFQIRDFYIGPHNLYHCFDHIDFMTGLWQKYRASFNQPDLALFVIICHDLDKDVAKSVELAVHIWKSLGLLEDDKHGHYLNYVKRGIPLTDHKHVGSMSGDFELICDIDLASLALPWQNFIQNSAKLRWEEPDLSKEQFWDKQRKLLEGLMARSTIYLTKEFADREQFARENITRLLKLLDARKEKQPPP